MRISFLKNSDFCIVNRKEVFFIQKQTKTIPENQLTDRKSEKEYRSGVLPYRTDSLTYRTDTLS